MSSLLSIYFKKETVEALLNEINKKNIKGIELTVSIADETNEFGQNVNSYVSQTKEQRDANAKRFYTGNGKVYWTDGKISKAIVKDKSNKQTQSNNEDLF